MKKDTHPEYHQSTIRCHCGYEFQAGSTKENISVEICSQCHPFYTGKQKLIDSAGRIERFRRKYSKFMEEETAEKKVKEKKTEVKKVKEEKVESVKAEVEAEVKAEAKKSEAEKTEAVKAEKTEEKAEVEKTEEKKAKKKKE